MNLAICMNNEVKETTIGQRIKQLRKTKDLTQTDLADLVGVSQQTIGNIENGGANSLKMPEIAEVLGVSLRYLKTGEDIEESELKLVDNALPETYSVEDISAALPGAYNKAVNTVRMLMLKQGKLENGDIPLIANKELFLEIFTKAILMEVTNDLLITESVTQELNKTNNN